MIAGMNNTSLRVGKMIKEYSKVIDNFLLPEEIVELSKYVKELMTTRDYVFINDSSKEESRGKWVVNHYVGRVNITLHKSMLPPNIASMVSKNSKEINPDSEFDFVEFVRYSTNFGNPRVDPHIDPPSKQAFMFNLQLNANTVWPIVEYVDGEASEIILKNNQCAVMDVNRVVHWRKPMALKDGEYVDMAFVHFNDNSIEPLPQSWYPLPPFWKDTDANSNSKKYKQELAIQYPNMDGQTMDELGEVVKNTVNREGLIPLLGI